MKIAHYEQIITPEVGEPAAGYDFNDVMDFSQGIHPLVAKYI